LCASFSIKPVKIKHGDIEEQKQKEMKMLWDRTRSHSLKGIVFFLVLFLFSLFARFSLTFRNRLFNLVHSIST